MEKKNNNFGGARPGAGRPKGSMNKTTKEQKIAEEYFRSRVINSISKLADSQFNIAQGCSYLYKIETTRIGKKRVKGKPILVTDQSEIEHYLAGDYDDQNDDYYFITTEKPDNKALDSLMDRVFGKALQPIDLSGDIDTNTTIELGDGLQSAVQAFEEAMRNNLTKKK